jgi:diguanylate cyclase (GGDEF)-like protein
MLPKIEPFPPSVEAGFRDARIAALAEINVTTYWPVSLLILSFSFWDWFVDPVNWTRALVVRVVGAAVIVSTGLLQRSSGRLDWALTIARVRYAAGVLSVAGAIAFLRDGYVVGLAGLMAVLFAGPYLAIDRREIFRLNAFPLLAVAVIMWLAEVGRFAAINAAIFIALAIAVSLLLARVFEATNRSAYLLEHALKHEARTDALTGLANRRALDETGMQHVARAARSRQPLSVILCDIDHFKQINDRLGHDAGDKVIRSVAMQLRKEARDSDSLGRWGGEEFLAILPDTTEAAARVLAERMRATLEASVSPVTGHKGTTASFGVAGALITPEDAEGRWPALLKAADDAMYRAKAAGRNRVVVASEEVASV